MSEPIFTRSNLTRGYSAALASALVLSTTAIFIRHLTVTYQMPALILAVWREVFVSLTLLIAFAVIRPAMLRISRRHIPYLLSYGFVLAIFNALWTLSVAMNGAAVSTVLAYCSTAFTVLLGWVFLRESPHAAKILVVVTTLAGCTFVAFGNQITSGTLLHLSTAGVMVGVLSGLLYAIYSLMGRSASMRGLNSWTTLFYIFSFAASFLTLFNLLTAFFPGVLTVPGAATQPADLLWLGTAWSGWGVLLLLAAVPTLAGYGLYNVSLGHLPSSIANLIVTTEPPFTAVIAYFAFGEMLDRNQIFGSLLILCGVVCLRLYEGRRNAREVPASTAPEVP
jgi:drug/metabolite transporter (DMT)-like permease